MSGFTILVLIFRLLDPPNFSFKDSKKKLSKEWTGKWEKEYLNAAVDRWSKISFTSFLQMRAKLPNSAEAKKLAKPIPVVKAKAVAVPIREPVKRGRKPRPKPGTVDLSKAEKSNHEQEPDTFVVSY